MHSSAMRRVSGVQASVRISRSIRLSSATEPVVSRNFFSMRPGSIPARIVLSATVHSPRQPAGNSRSALTTVPAAMAKKPLRPAKRLPRMFPASSYSGATGRFS